MIFSYTALLKLMSPVWMLLKAGCLTTTPPVKTQSFIIAPDHSIPVIKHSLGPFSAHAQRTVRNIGVSLDQSLSLDSHVSQLNSSSFFHLRNIAKLRSVVTRVEMEVIIHAFISSRLDYCNALFTCLNQTTLNRLQIVQNAVARLLISSNKRSHITPILSFLHWLPIKFRINFKILVLTFRALHGQMPQYIVDLLLPYSPNLTLRSSDEILLTIPRTHFKTRGDRGFQAVAQKIWNALPFSLRSTDSCTIFMKRLKTFLFRQAFGWLIKCFYLLLLVLMGLFYFILFYFIFFNWIFIVLLSVFLLLLWSTLWFYICERCYMNKLYLLTYLLKNSVFFINLTCMLVSHLQCIHFGTLTHQLGTTDLECHQPDIHSNQTWEG